MAFPRPKRSSGRGPRWRSDFAVPVAAAAPRMDRCDAHGAPGLVAGVAWAHGLAASLPPSLLRRSLRLGARLAVLLSGVGFARRRTATAALLSSAWLWLATLRSLRARRSYGGAGRGRSAWVHLRNPHGARCALRGVLAGTLGPSAQFLRGRAVWAAGRSPPQAVFIAAVLDAVRTPMGCVVLCICAPLAGCVA
eukprot:523572-Alexandrium_andersonii.AAC.1